MNAAQFYKLALALWGEDWRPELMKLLEAHGMSYSRMSVWSWRKGRHPVPDEVAALLMQAKHKRKERV